MIDSDYSSMIKDIISTKFITGNVSVKKLTCFSYEVSVMSSPNEVEEFKKLLNENSILNEFIKLKEDYKNVYSFYTFDVDFGNKDLEAKVMYLKLSM